MSKPATKAANSPFYLARMEAAKVNDRFSSREGAADETGIDRTRLARIELDSITPYPEEVMLLADAYDAVLAAVQDGTISEQRLDESVAKILRMKAQFCA